MNGQRYVVHESKEVTTLANIISLVDEKDNRVLKTYRYKYNPNFKAGEHILYGGIANRMAKVIYAIERAGHNGNYYTEKDYISEFCFTIYSWHKFQQVIILGKDSLKDAILEAHEDNFEAIKQLKEAGL